MSFSSRCYWVLVPQQTFSLTFCLFRTPFNINIVPTLATMMTANVPNAVAEKGEFEFQIVCLFLRWLYDTFNMLTNNIVHFSHSYVFRELLVDVLATRIKLLSRRQRILWLYGSSVTWPLWIVFYSGVTVTIAWTQGIYRLKYYNYTENMLNFHMKESKIWITTSSYIELNWTDMANT